LEVGDWAGGEGVRGGEAVRTGRGEGQCYRENGEDKEKSQKSLTLGKAETCRAVRGIIIQREKTGGWGRKGFRNAIR